MNELPPLQNLNELESADADQINAQIRWELKRLMIELGLSQLDVAVQIGYASSAGAFSRWVKGPAAIPTAKAPALDKQFAEFELSLPGETFKSLHARQARRKVVRPAIAHVYDVFIASPMASAVPVGTNDDGYAAERSAAMQLAEAVTDYCGFDRIYYAGSAIESSESFESPTLSVEANAEALHSARYFILLALEAPIAPSGIYVEAGMALALGKPSVYFVPDSGRHYLPWMLRTIGEHTSPRLPRVSIEPVNSVREAIARVRHHRRGLFTRLER
jgi:transcriptional regulator with XRE-family HTH domain